MKYISTRNKNIIVDGSEAVLSALASDGGLYVPSEIPNISLDEIKQMAELDYAERSAKVMSYYFTELSYEQLLEITTGAYETFDGDPAPLVMLNRKLALLELWHGKTHAFKDMALSVLPRLMTKLKSEIGQSEVCFLPVATSGDTGKAALEGFANVPGTAVIVFYPDSGVSSVQKKQMCTTKADNVNVVGIKGNFDDAQTAVKNAMNNADVISALADCGCKVTGANSINWGRLAPQIAYYFSSYVDMCDGEIIEWGDKIDFCVPTGNFGNILAGYYAKQMGLPIRKLICASNDNNVLTDFINNGVYSIKDREFKKTISPSMDILISSNLERLLFELAGRDDMLIKEYMASLRSDKEYSIGAMELNRLQETFVGIWASEEEDKEIIEYMFDEYGYICDTHTGVALSAYHRYEAENNPPCVVVSTASPYKFTSDVLVSLGEQVPNSDLKAIAKLEEITALPAPESLTSIMNEESIFTDVCEVSEVFDVIQAFAKNVKEGK